MRRLPAAALLDVVTAPRQRRALVTQLRDPLNVLQTLLKLLPQQPDVLALVVHRKNTQISSQQSTAHAQVECKGVT